MANAVSGVVVLLSLLVAVATVACDKTYGVTYEYQTSKTVTVYRFGQRDISLEPFEVYTYDVFEFDEMLVEARDETGATIFSEVISWATLKERDWTITIVAEESEDPLPTR